MNNGKKIVKVGIGIVYIGVIVIVFCIVFGSIWKKDDGSKVQLKEVQQKIDNSIDKIKESMSNSKEMITRSNASGNFKEFNGVLEGSNYKELRASLYVKEVSYLIKKVDDLGEVYQAVVRVVGDLKSEDGSVRAKGVELMISYEAGKNIKAGDVIDVVVTACTSISERTVITKIK